MTSRDGRRSMNRSDPTPATAEGAHPWQLAMFERSLKKRQKLDQIVGLIGPTDGKRCLLVTNGDNNGALNVHLRSSGGEWTWNENEERNLADMERLLGEPVLAGRPDRIPVADRSQDLVVSIDVHEHLDDCAAFNRELFRVLRPGGTAVVSTPNGDARKPVTVLKGLVGMTKERYGHKVIGYTIAQHRQMLRAVGFEPLAAASYSRFFTESIELAINFAYVKLLRRGDGRPEGEIAPTSADGLAAVGASYRLYSLVFPLLRTLARADAILSFTTGYAVTVIARRPDAPR